MEKRDILRQIDELKKEINNSKNNLNNLNKEKEFWFSKKEALKKDLFSLIVDIKKLKSSSDIFNQEIIKLRDERDSYYNKNKEFIKNITILNDEKRKLLKDNKIKFNPKIIKEEIERIEYKIETEALSFDKEKKLMKEINGLKKTYQESSEINSLFDKIDDLDKTIKSVRKKSDETSNKLREIFNSNKEDINKFKELSKRIYEKRKEQQSAFDKFIEHKNKFLEANNKLKVELNDLKLLQNQFQDIENKLEKDKEIIKQKNMEQREKEIEEKLLTKKKLTKDDLIMLQQ